MFPKEQTLSVEQLKLRVSTTQNTLQGPRPWLTGLSVKDLQERKHLS